MTPTRAPPSGHDHYYDDCRLGGDDPRTTPPTCVDEKEKPMREQPKAQRIRRGLLLLVAVTVAVVAASAAVAATSVRASGPTTITFWNGFTDADQPAVMALVNKFNASQNGVRVKVSIMKWAVLFQKLLPAFAAGQGPDIVAMDTQQLPGYASKGVFQPIGDLYASNAVPTKHLNTAAKASSMYQGKQYGVPMSFGDAAFYWNKDLFAKAGLDPNSPPKTWAEWASDAVKLTQGDDGQGRPTQYGIVFPDQQAVQVWPVLMWENGGGVVSANGKQATIASPASVQAVKYWADLVLNKHVSPTGLTGVDADKLFAAGKAAMELNGPWASGAYKGDGLNFGLGNIPAGPKGRATVGISIAMYLNAKADAKKKAAAAAFFNYWNSKPVQIAWSLHSGWPPTRTDIPATAFKSNPYISKFAAAGTYARFYLGGVKQFAAIDGTVVIPTIQKIENGANIDETLQAAQQQIASLLGQ
jgi:multiple sugar transport system substrate-binding protein